MAFPPWINVFGGGPVWPSSVSYISYDLDTIGQSIVLEFPQVAVTDFVTAGTINVLTSNAAHTITMPDVTIVSVGYTIWIRNNGSANLPVKKADGSSLVVIAPGLTWFIQVIDNSTPAGVWYTGQFGAGSSSANAAALAGPGLTVDPLDSTRLATNITSRNISSGGYTIQESDRATLLVWTGGTDTILLPDITGLSGFLCYISNLGTGILTLQCSIGGQKINNQDAVFPKIGDSFILNAGDTEYYTIGVPGLNFSSNTFPDGSIANPSINYISDTTSGYSHVWDSSGTQALNFSLNGDLQFSVFTLGTVAHAAFTNDVSAVSYLSTAGLYAFTNDPTKTRIERVSVGDGFGNNIVKTDVYLDGGSLGLQSALDSRGWFNLPQGDFERDAISYAAWTRIMV